MTELEKAELHWYRLATKYGWFKRPDDDYGQLTLLLLHKDLADALLKLIGLVSQKFKESVDAYREVSS